MSAAKVRRAFSFLLLFFFPLMTSAWNAVGHMTVAEIAYHQLTPNAKAKIDKLVPVMQSEYNDMTSFEHLAYWPDALHSQKIETYTHWHYIDIALTSDGTPTKSLTDTDNAVWAYHLVSKVVANDRANPTERVRFLAFLIHIVADLHQPLHTVSRISAAYPDGDRGGNLFEVRFKKKMVKMHHLWDMALGELPNGNSEETATQIAANLMAQYPEASFDKDAQDLNTDHWLEEGMVNAKKYVYNIKEHDAVTTAYLQSGKRAAEKELALAGYRLGHILNQLLG